MAITVIRRPQGHKLSATLYSAEASNSGGKVLFTTDANHGLSDGDYIYIDSDIETYNGFKYVESTGYTTFQIRESATSALIDFKQAVSIDFFVSVLNHGYQCVHLPIVYELASDLFPFNEPADAYTPNVILSFEDYAGSVRIHTQNSLSDPVALLKIELIGNGPLAGVYQITNVIQPWDVVIDLVYDATYDFSGYQVVKYYDNYAIHVNIYAGLTASHPWYDEKPIELVASKKFIPGSNNRVLFSIDEILRGFIKTRNNLALDTLPNNIDFLCEFYIGYFQSWDVVEDGELVNEPDTEVIDTFIGQAINAKNEFKNLYSGYLSDYLSEGNSFGRWLTDFDEPTAIVGYFFDISFLNASEAEIQVSIEKYLNDALVATEMLELGEVGIGVIRVPITPETGYDYYCLKAYAIGEGEESDFNLSNFDNFGSGIDWVTGSSPSITSSGSPWTSKYLRDSFVGEPINTFNLQLDFSSASGANIEIGYMDSLGNVVGSEVFQDLAIFGIQNFTVTVEATGEYAFIFVRTYGTTPTAFDIVSFSVVEPLQITEEICIRILEECGDTFDGDARLTQEGGLRILE